MSASRETKAELLCGRMNLIR